MTTYPQAQQPRSDSSSNRPYRPRPPDVTAQPVGDSSRARPPTQNSVDGEHAAQRGNFRQYGGMGQNERVAYNEGRSRSVDPRKNTMRGWDGDMRGPPEQERPINPERRGYVDPRARGQLRPGYAPAANDYLPARDGQLQYRNPRRQHEQQPAISTEPVFCDEPEDIHEGKVARATGYSDRQDYRPPPRQYSVTNVARAERSISSNQHQDCREPYRQEISPENSSRGQENMYADAPKSRFTSNQIYTRSGPARRGLDESVASMSLNKRQARPPNDGRRSEDSRARPSFSPNGSDAARSNTMPSKISNGVQNRDHQRGYADRPGSQGRTGPIGGNHRAESVEHFSSRPDKNSQAKWNGGSGRHPDKTFRGPDPVEKDKNGGGPLRRTHSAQNSLNDFYDSYYNTSQHDLLKAKDEAPNSPDEEMPNFDAIPTTYKAYNSGISIDDHLPPVNKIPDSPQSPYQYHRGNSESSRSGGNTPGQVSRSKSQPNLNSPNNQPNNGFNFDFGNAPPVPPITPVKDTFGTYSEYPPPRTTSRNASLDQRNMPPFHGGSRLNDMGHQVVQQPYERYNTPTPQDGYVPPRAGWGTRPGTPASGQNPGNGIGPNVPRVSYPESPGPLPPHLVPGRPGLNPDALPLHPVPTRPGLMYGSSAQQPPRQPPPRNYTSSPSSSHQLIPPPPPEVSPPPTAKRESIPVTLGELENLRQAIKTNPSDQSAQLTLAKKLAEAAFVLVDNLGRANEKAKTKAREKYNHEAHRTVKKLVSNNYVEAIFHYGDCYSRGLLGLEVDPKEAFNLYITAAKAGHAQSSYRVAVCCEMGHEDGGGTRRDPHKAMQWYKRAATLGDTPAMYKIGIIQLKGLLGQPKNSSEALIWLKRAAERADQENPHALHELVRPTRYLPCCNTFHQILIVLFIKALLHAGTSPDQPVPKDEGYALQLFTKAACLGYKFSQFRLGVAYEYGFLGCPVDARQSIAWYSKAAVQEEHQSELALSGWYLTGAEGVLQPSDTEAYLWARKAAQAGLAKAEYAMGYFTEVGIVGPASVEEAKRWYWRSACEHTYTLSLLPSLLFALSG